MYGLKVKIGGDGVQSSTFKKVFEGGGLFELFSFKFYLVPIFWGNDLSFTPVYPCSALLFFWLVFCVISQSGFVWVAKQAIG